MTIKSSYTFVAAALSAVTVANGQTSTPLKFAGVNIAGFGECCTTTFTRHADPHFVDFGCSTDGTCVPSQAVPPVYQLSGKNYLEKSPHTLTYLSGIDGLGQMQHFVKDDGYNIFRLPVGWQYLTNGQMTGVLDETHFSNYNMLVSDCLSTGAHCEIDIHNYARYDGQVRDHALPIVKGAQYHKRLLDKVARATKFSLSSGPTLHHTGRTRRMLFSECM
jgi:endoglucanase